MRKLTDTQIDIIAGYVADGLPLRAAATKCLELWNIQVSHVTLSSYEEIKKAISIRNKLQVAEVKENLDKSVKPVVDSMLKNLSETTEDIDALRVAQKAMPVGGKEYLDASKEIRQLRKTHNELMKTFNSLCERSENINQNDLAPETVERDRKRRLKDQLSLFSFKVDEDENDDKDEPDKGYN